MAENTTTETEEQKAERVECSAMTRLGEWSIDELQILVAGAGSSLARSELKGRGVLR